jgi:hypothetical protein
MSQLLVLRRNGQAIDTYERKYLLNCHESHEQLIVALPGSCQPTGVYAHAATLATSLSPTREISQSRRIINLPSQDEVPAVACRGVPPRSPPFHAPALRAGPYATRVAGQLLPIPIAEWASNDYTFRCSRTGTSSSDSAGETIGRKIMFPLQRRVRKRGRSAKFEVEPLERRTLLTSAVVNTVVDGLFPPSSGIVSLRNAIATANSSSTPTAITFDPTVFAMPQTITLNGTGLSITGSQSTTVTGPALGVTVNGSGLSIKDSLFIQDSKTDVAITNMSFTNGYRGLDILADNGATVSLANVIVSGNTEGVSVEGNGTVNLENVTVSSNTGSGIAVVGDGEPDPIGNLNITNTTISGNGDGAEAIGNGGNGIYNANRYDVTLTGVTISNNIGLDGGAISNFSNMTLSNVTIEGNVSGYSSYTGTLNGYGGGIFNGSGGTLSVTNTTISDNTSTVTANILNAVGGGIFNAAGATTTIDNSIVAGNAINSGTGPDVAGSINSLGFNLVGKTDGSTGWTSTDLTGTTALPLDPVLAPLANYGGPTQTMVPMPASPAIDAGFNAFALDANGNPLTTDQRGYPRIYNGRVDIGSVEFQPQQVNAAAVTLEQDADHLHIDWTVSSTTGQFLIADPEGMMVNGNGGNDTITLDYTNGNPLPSILHLNGTFTVNELQGTNPLAGTTLEIGKSTVFITYSTSDPIAAIQGYLQNGYNAGAWNGTPTASTGVITCAAAQANPNHNTAIGYADSADGQGVNTMPNTIELTYTLYGDANLDHQVNSADLQVLLAFLNRTGAWDQGDFNYDGQVNSADLQNLLFTLNTSLGSQATPMAIAATATITTPSRADSSGSSDPSPHLVPAIHPTGTTGPVAHHPHAAKLTARKRR